MPYVGVTTGVPPEDDILVVGRLVNPIDGAVYQAGDFTTWDAHLFDPDGNDIYNNTGLTVSDTDPIYNTLFTDGTWGSRDSTGGNFKWQIDQGDLSAVTVGGESYIFLAIFDGGATLGLVRRAWKIVTESLAPTVL